MERSRTGGHPVGAGGSRRRALLVAAAAALTAAVGVSLWQGPAARLVARAGELAARYWPGLVLLLAAGLLFLLAMRRRDDTRTGRGADDVREPGEPRWPWVLSDTGVVTVTGTVLAAGVVALAVMWQIADRVPDDQRGKVQIDAVKYGLGFVAAAGAAVALLLGVRRQQLAEHTHRLELRKQSHAETDAAARRVTDLYTKAVEQLGSADAAVRLGGLYALERVAQDNPRQRQTIVDVICAYLRMPYTPPAEDDTPTAAKPLADLPSPTRRTPTDSTRDARQELQVRLTAQRLLAAHLAQPETGDASGEPGSTPFWADIDLDLTGATLVGWSLTTCRVRNAVFDTATFTGSASFDTATFAGGASFGRATFTGEATFGRATFAGEASFREARFTADAYFTEARFTRYTSFGEARFDGDAYFVETAFAFNASFREAQVTGDAYFRRAAFVGDAYFAGAAFAGDAYFGETTFTGDTDFSEATFVLRPELARAVVTRRESREDFWPPGWRLVPDGDGLRLVPPPPRPDDGTTATAGP